MTKANFTSINVIIDRSGSMAGLTQDTIGSFNEFLAEQKVVPGEAAFTLCTFNSDYQLVHDFVKLGTVPDLNAQTYRPSGNTALLDAMGTTIDSVGQKLAAMPEDERPSKVIFLIITDGQENASRRFSKDQIKAKVEHQKDVYDWEFVFMGANIDAISGGLSMGIDARNSMNYDSTSIGTKQLYKTVSENMSSYRGGGASKVDFFNQKTEQQVVTPTVVTTVTTTLPGTGPTKK